MLRIFLIVLLECSISAGSIRGLSILVCIIRDGDLWVIIIIRVIDSRSISFFSFLLLHVLLQKCLRRQIVVIFWICIIFICVLVGRRIRSVQVIRTNSHILVILVSSNAIARARIIGRNSLILILCGSGILVSILIIKAISKIIFILSLLVAGFLNNIFRVLLILWIRRLIIRIINCVIQNFFRVSSHICIGGSSWKIISSQPWSIHKFFIFCPFFCLVFLAQIIILLLCWWYWICLRGNLIIIKRPCLWAIINALRNWRCHILRILLYQRVRLGWRFFVRSVVVLRGCLLLLGRLILKLRVSWTLVHALRMLSKLLLLINLLLLLQLLLL